MQIQIQINVSFPNCILETMASSGPSKNEDGEMPPADDGKLFTLKKWNVVAMWSWDVECDTCAIW